MNRRNRTLLRAIAPLLLMGMIFYFSAQSSSGDHAWWDVILRKLGHVTGYALLTALWWWVLRGVIGRPLLIAVCIASAYACTDVAIDSIGMAIAALLIKLRRKTSDRRTEIDPEALGLRSSPARSP